MIIRALRSIVDYLDLNILPTEQSLNRGRSIYFIMCKAL